MQKVLFLLCVISSSILLGCGDSAKPQAQAPSDGELTQFLADNEFGVDQFERGVGMSRDRRKLGQHVLGGAPVASPKLSTKFSTGFAQLLLEVFSGEFLAGHNARST